MNTEHQILTILALEKPITAPIKIKIADGEKSWEQDFSEVCAEIADFIAENGAIDEIRLDRDANNEYLLKWSFLSKSSNQQFNICITDPPGEPPAASIDWRNKLQVEIIINSRHK